MNFLNQNSYFPFFGGNQLVVLVVVAWSLAWKGLALWHSSKLNQKNWFIALLVLNTVGILEILYLFVFAAKKLNINTILKNK